MRPIPLHCDRPARDGARLTGTALDVIDGVTAPVIIVGHNMGAQVETQQYTGAGRPMTVGDAEPVKVESDAEQERHEQA